MGDYMIPYEILSDTELGKKRVLFYISISYSCMSIEDMVIFCGYSKQRRSGNIQSQLAKFQERLAEIKRKNGFGSHGYSAITQNEFNTIIQYSNSRSVSQAICLLLLAYIRYGMFSGEDKPRAYIGFKKRIESNLKIGRRALDSGLAALDNLDIIHYKTMERYQDYFGNWRSNVSIFVNAYCDGNYNWRKEMSKACIYVYRNMVD